MAKNKKLLLRLSNWSLLSGRKLFEKIKKAKIKRELNALYTKRIHTKTESRMVVGQYQKILKKLWKYLGKDEQVLWDNLAVEERDRIGSADNSNLQIDE